MKTSLWRTDMQKKTGFIFLIVCCLILLGNLDAGLAAFREGKDLISLHYDHAADRDDGQSAAADRTILQSEFGVNWIKAHVIAVSGAYGINADKFVSESNTVMNAVWNECGGWIAADENWKLAVSLMTDRWIDALKAGGHVWVKEGGQSDITAEVVSRIHSRLPGIDTTARIHVVQHGLWNEDHTTPSALSFVKRHTDYIKISNANEYLKYGPREKAAAKAAFAEAAMNHPDFGAAWRAAFAYLDPSVKMDFSDTGELMYILGLGEMNIEAFKERYLFRKNNRDGNPSSNTEANDNRSTVNDTTN